MDGRGIGVMERAPEQARAGGFGQASRLRTAVMIAVFDLGGPLVAYTLLRDLAHLPTVAALILSGLFPALGVALNAIQFRRMDIFGLLILGGIAMGSLIGFVTHDPRLYLLEGSLPSAVFGVLCLASLRTRRPLIYRIALEFVGPESRKGLQIRAAWRDERFRRAFRKITVGWGIGYLIESAFRVVVTETTSTGIALVISKAAPYAFAGVLAAWTIAYGERRMRDVGATPTHDICHGEMRI